MRTIFTREYRFVVNLQRIHIDIVHLSIFFLHSKIHTSTDGYVLVLVL